MNAIQFNVIDHRTTTEPLQQDRLWFNGNDRANTVERLHNPQTPETAVRADINKYKIVDS